MAIDKQLEYVRSNKEALYKDEDTANPPVLT